MLVRFNPHFLGKTASFRAIDFDRFNGLKMLSKPPASCSMKSEVNAHQQISAG